MNSLASAFLAVSPHYLPVLDRTISTEAYTKIDFSMNNKSLEGLDLSDHKVCQGYVDQVLKARHAQVAYGGYFERRKLYKDLNTHSQGDYRDVHLGIDFWAAAGTKVLAPLEGKVHSFKNNATPGDYGPTIVLEHQLMGLEFFTLYGHLASHSLLPLKKGRVFGRAEPIAVLGTPEENVGYAPHLHFQIIKDMHSFEGDYPGVCSVADSEFYKNNCPDPNLLLKIAL